MSTSGLRRACRIGRFIKAWTWDLVGADALFGRSDEHEVEAVPR